MKYDHEGERRRKETRRRQASRDARTAFIGIFFALVTLTGIAWAIVAWLEG